MLWIMLFVLESKNKSINQKCVQWIKFDYQVFRWVTITSSACWKRESDQRRKPYTAASWPATTVRRTGPPPPASLLCWTPSLHQDTEWMSPAGGSSPPSPSCTPDRQSRESVGAGRELLSVLLSEGFKNSFIHSFIHKCTFLFLTLKGFIFIFYFHLFFILWLNCVFSTLCLWNICYINKVHSLWFEFFINCC